MTGYDEAKKAASELKGGLVNAPKVALEKLDESYFRDNARVGIEAVTPEDLPIPTLSIIQKTSDINDASGNPLPRGKFYHSGTKQAFESVSCSFLVLTKKDLPSYANKEVTVRTHIYMGALLPSMKPFVMYFKSAGIGKSKELLSKVLDSGKPMYALKLNLTTERIDGDKGTYWLPVVSVEGMHDNIETIVQLEELAKRFSHMPEEAEVV